MRHITRLPKPDILVEKEQEWLTKFLTSGKNRPDNNKYGHDEILDALKQSSHHKCFYCETLLKGISKEIDHYIEVSIDKTKAFEWENLYLACENCNNKKNNNQISVDDVLNPCVDTNEEIQKHIYFDKELIFFNTDKGKLTIQKYGFDKPEKDYLRMKKIDEFKDLLLKIKDKMIEKRKSKMSNKQKQKLKQYISPQNEYSLMFEQYFRN